MAGYRKPKTRLHHEFVYLNHDTVINALSGLEAGKIDEIIEKVSEAREGGFEGSLGYGAAKVGGSKKKTANVEEELTRSRTHFSAFEAWHSRLDAADAFGELDEWDLATRNEIEVGDTIKFTATVSLAPVQQVLLTFMDFAKQAGDPSSPFKQPTAKLAETKKIASQMNNWMGGRDGARSILSSIAPLGIATPRVFARLAETYLVNGAGVVEGEFTVIAQVEQLINQGSAVPAIRVLRETPPTPKETETITEALKNFIEPAAGLGLTVTPGDITLEFPGVLLHPIAIYR
ncbi:DUF6414 family protein [Herbiconiux flava]|uniref:Uncharacterized protein n=1 Tax=Herbiconiux flava TaxID=881268 RepID=A0A852SQ94_9MICO|nr:hypothetical protein [Herbiconiux flava]NYD70989.1 hypothetical protein [Herbiconiux flava]GLK19047.1 hypothetical protein GCM10017602_35290 [Herbiconiux flava]